jgi:integrase
MARDKRKRPLITTDRSIAGANKPGLYRDADVRGLYLSVTKRDDRVRKSWLLRYMINGKAHAMGLGSPANGVGLKLAREKALAARVILTDGSDPLEEREKQKAEDEVARINEMRLTKRFKEVAAELIKAKRAGWGARYCRQWENQLRIYAEPTLGQKPISAIDMGLIEDVLAPIWTTKPATAQKLRFKIQVVFEFATKKGYYDRAKPNPAIEVIDVLSTPPKGRNMKALDHREVPDLMVKLGELGTEVADALAFTILTVSRNDEARLLPWSEIDFKRAIWTLPADRSKARRHEDVVEYRIPLPNEALAILQRRHEQRDGDYVFPRKGGHTFASDAMLKLSKALTGKDITTHGFRSAFKTWASDETHHPRDVIERAMKHKIGSETERAYERSDQFAKRKLLMADWSRYATTPRPAETATDNVVAFAAG